MLVKNNKDFVSFINFINYIKIQVYCEKDQYSICQSRLLHSTKCCPVSIAPSTRRKYDVANFSAKTKLHSIFQSHIAPSQFRNIYYKFLLGADSGHSTDMKSPRDELFNLLSLYCLQQRFYCVWFFLFYKWKQFVIFLARRVTITVECVFTLNNWT